MKVGTDGVLLGAWTGVGNAAAMLDVGTGSGLIALMLAQRSEALIDAVEVDESACIQARENAAISRWKDRIHIFNDSFQHFAETTMSHYDVIVSNPPYFRNSLKPQGKSKSLARHDVGLNHGVLISAAAGLLTPGGRLALIIPADDSDHVIETAYFNGLYPSRLLRVRPVAEGKFTRCLLEFTRDRNRVCREDELMIRQPGQLTFSEPYMTLTRDFYLKF
jgi:tRNA1Val (adenine37-N6)-methyltransferase